MNKVDKQAQDDQHLCYFSTPKQILPATPHSDKAAFKQNCMHADLIEKRVVFWYQSAPLLLWH